MLNSVAMDVEQETMVQMDSLSSTPSPQPEQLPRRASLLLLVLVGILSSGVLGGCGARQKAWLVFDKGPIARAVAVDVTNFRGPVTVIADPTVPNVAVRAQLRTQNRVARLSGTPDTDEITDHSLDKINVVAKWEDDESGHAILHVDARTSFEYPDAQFVRLMIYVPEVRGVRVQTKDGNVDLSGVQGAITVVNRNADVIVRSANPINQPVSIITTGGAINYRVTPDCAGIYNAQAINGRVNFHGMETTSIIRQTGASELIATVEHGTNPVNLRSSNGNIDITFDDNPVPIGFLETHTFMFLK